MPIRAYINKKSYVLIGLIILSSAAIIALDAKYTKAHQKSLELNRTITAFRQNQINARKAKAGEQATSTVTATNQAVRPPVAEVNLIPAVTTPEKNVIIPPVTPTALAPTTTTSPSAIIPPLADAIYTSSSTGNLQPSTPILPIANATQQTATTTQQLPLQIAPNFATATASTSTATIIPAKVNVLSTLSNQEIANNDTAEPSENNTTPLSKALIDAANTDVTAENSAEIIMNVYNPEQNNDLNDPQTQIDDIKKRYEGILVLHMYMLRCQNGSSEDYGVITSSLAQEISDVNAPGKTYNDIIMSAQGSYEEVYSKSVCNDPGMPELKQQYSNYIMTLKQNFLRNP